MKATCPGEGGSLPNFRLEWSLAEWKMTPMELNKRGKLDLTNEKTGMSEEIIMGQ